MKKFWKENKVLFMLIVILIVCFIAICSVVVSYFVGSHKSIYGERLVEKVEVSNKAKEKFIDKLKEDELVEDADFRVSIRTIYLDIDFAEKATLVEAQSKAAASIEELDENLLKYYDINFILSKDDTETEAGFIIMGSRNSNGTGISWNNNTKIEEEKEEKE